MPEGVVPLVVWDVDLASLKFLHDVRPEALEPVGELADVVDREEEGYPLPELPQLDCQELGDVPREVWPREEKVNPGGGDVERVV